MVLALPNSLLAQDLLKMSPLFLVFLLPPLPHSLEHHALAFLTIISKRWMMENL
jgi:hypothetical protein